MKYAQNGIYFTKRETMYCNGKLFLSSIGSTQALDLGSTQVTCIATRSLRPCLPFALGSTFLLLYGCAGYWIGLVLDLDYHKKTMLVLYSGLYIPVGTWRCPLTPAIPPATRCCWTSSTVSHWRGVALITTWPYMSLFSSLKLGWPMVNQSQISFLGHQENGKLDNTEKR